MGMGVAYGSMRSPICHVGNMFYHDVFSGMYRSFLFEAPCPRKTSSMKRCGSAEWSATRVSFSFDVYRDMPLWRV